VIYLEEAVERKRLDVGGRLDRAALRDAVMEGAVLRLRPKVMTVATVIAGLLPIMWSTSVGAEVMKPLATPVLGGMVSSLLHVLIVTPVIFFWLRERQLGLQEDEVERGPDRQSRRTVLAGGLLALALVTGVAWMLLAPGQEGGTAGQEVVAVVPTGDIDVTLLAADGALKQGRSVFVIEFRRRGRSELVSVADVRASATMNMPGMVMPGNLVLTPAGVNGRYQATAEFGMAGTWRLVIEWTAAAGRASVSFDGEVQ
jgi:hypothetical protein